MKALHAHNDIDSDLCSCVHGVKDQKYI